LKQLASETLTQNILQKNGLEFTQELFSHYLAVGKNKTVFEGEKVSAKLSYML
jgi:hypothetical protein